MARRGAILTAQSYVEVFADLDRLRTNLKAGERMVAAFANKVGQIGTAMLKASSVLAAPQALGIRVFASYEKSMSRVKALTQATEEQFGRLSAKAQELGRTTVFTAGEAADAMSEFALAGFKVDQILAATGPTLDLAAAGQIGIAEAASISSKIMAGMGFSAEELTGVVDILAKAMSTANTDVSQLGNAFKFVGPVAKTAGVSFEEITAAIQMLSNAGIQGEMAGTTLRGMIMTLSSPTDVARKELHKLGVAITDSEGRIYPLVEILSQFESALQGMENGERLDILGRIFPDRQAAGGIELIAQGAAKLREMTAALEDSGGTAARISSTQLDNLWGGWQLIKSAMESVAISWSSALAPALRDVQVHVINVVTALDNWVRNNPDAVRSIALFTVGLGAAGAALLATKVALLALAGTMGLLAAVIASPITQIAALLYFTGAFDQAIAAVKASVAGLGPIWSQSWGAIQASVADGDLPRAFELTFAAIEVTVLTVIDHLRAEFTVLFDFIDATLEALKAAWQMAKDAVAFVKDAAIVVTGGTLEYVPETGGYRRAGDLGKGSRPAQSDSTINAETRLRKLLDEAAKPKAAAEPGAAAADLPPTAPSAPLAVPIDDQLGQQIVSMGNASFTPLGQFERGSDAATQLVLDALGMGGQDTMDGIYEEMKTVAAATTAQVELTREAKRAGMERIGIARRDS